MVGQAILPDFANALYKLRQDLCGSPKLIYYLVAESLSVTGNLLHWRNNGRTFVELCGHDEQSRRTALKRLFPDSQGCERRLGL